MKGQKLAHLLSRDVDNSPLILFRIAFGGLMFLEGIGAILTGWLKATFVDPSITFNFIGFDFLQVLVGPQMYTVYILISLLGLAVMIGWNYRMALLLFNLLWGATYLLQKSHYNNHYYLVWLIGICLLFVPANAYHSLDSRNGRSYTTCPFYCLLIFQVQIAIVYFYASIAKIYPDWLQARPVGLWFVWKSYASFLWSDAVAHDLKDFFSQQSVHYFMSYAGIIFDLLVIPAFLWKRTRTIALVASLVFHLMNSALFEIGIFPYFALSFVLFFYPRETVRKLFFPKKAKVEEVVFEADRSGTKASFPKWSIVILIYFIVQLLLPLRHWRIPGDVLWTEEGHRLSWRMMLRSKSGYAKFRVLNAEEGINKIINPLDYLTVKQMRDMSWKPDMIWQFAQIIEADYIEERGVDDVAVYVDSRVSVNGRQRFQLTDASVDLSEVKWNRFGHQKWLLPKPF